MSHADIIICCAFTEIWFCPVTADARTTVLVGTADGGRTLKGKQHVGVEFVFAFLFYFLLSFFFLLPFYYYLLQYYTDWEPLSVPLAPPTID
jgi:hypothetical protein